MGTGANGLAVYLPHVDSLFFPADVTSVGAFEQLATVDRCRLHSVVSRPEEADIILFTEFHWLDDWRAREIRYHPVRREFPQRCYGYDQRDFPWPALPGIFVSERANRLIRPYQVPWCYAGLSEVSRHDQELGLPAMSTASVEPDLLFSFMGSPSAPVRDALFGLPHHPRGVVERVEGFVFFDPGSRDFAARRARFLELLMRSKFVLCPRGHGTSTFRVYEAMAVGRVPVILSDKWVEPAGPDWGSLSVRWPERMARELPAFLESIEERYETMAASAANSFGEWFGPEVAFHSVVEALRPLVENGAASDFPYNGVRKSGYARCALRTLAVKARVATSRGR